MSTSSATLSSDSNIRHGRLDQRASVTLTADTALGMIVAVEEAHCLLGTSAGQPASVMPARQIPAPLSI